MPRTGTQMMGYPLSDYRESDFKRNPKEIENTSLFKHTFQRKKLLIPKKSVTMKSVVLTQQRNVVSAFGI